MVFLLDTNVWVNWLRGKSPSLRQHVESKSVSEIAICSVVLSELLYGAQRSSFPQKNRIAVEALVQPFVCLPFDGAAAEVYSTIRYQLEIAGQPIGPYDLQIASIAISNGCTVVTHNTSEFQRVPDLLMEDWETA